MMETSTTNELWSSKGIADTSHDRNVSYENHAERPKLQRTTASKQFNLQRAHSIAEEPSSSQLPSSTYEIDEPDEQNMRPRSLSEDKRRKLMRKLNSAMFRGELREVELFISQGVDIAAMVDDNGQTCLHVAATNGHYELVQFLLQKNHVRDINATDQHGWTALLGAASVGAIRTCALLLRHNADPKIPNSQKTTVLHYLCRKPYQPEGIRDGSKSDVDYEGVLQLVLDKGVDINARNFRGETPLMQACARGNEVGVKWLLAHKAKWKLVDEAGHTAQFYAENSGSEAVAKILNAKMEKDSKGKLKKYNVKLDQLDQVIKIMTDPEDGVVLKDRKSLFITHRNCFTGDELVSWILRHLSISTRDAAVEYAQRLMNANWVVGISNKKKFKDSKSLYTFSTGEAPAEKPAEQTVSIDDFEQLKVLGKGGFGKVVLGRKKDNGKLYAIKIMEKARIMNKPRDFKNLMSEKKILQNDCSFLVHLHWAFQTDTDFYLVMDFLGGGDLHYHWKLVRRFPGTEIGSSLLPLTTTKEKVVQFIAAELVLALSYLHSCGIIYRDLKPQNVLLDTLGHIRLADFGLSKEVMSTDTALHTACGTPTYSAPEVLEGNPYNKAIDYWGLGIVMYQLLVGKTPFEFDGDFAKLLHSIQNGRINYPADLISERAISVLEAFLQRDPKRRLDDADIIKRHPFFKGIDWDKLEVKRVQSPIKLTTKKVEKNFDPKYTRLPVQDEVQKQPRPDIPDFSVVFD